MMATATLVKKILYRRGGGIIFGGDSWPWRRRIRGIMAGGLGVAMAVKAAEMAILWHQKSSRQWRRGVKYISAR